MNGTGTTTLLGHFTSVSDFSHTFVHISSICFYCFYFESTFHPVIPSNGTPLYEIYLLDVPPQPLLPAPPENNTTQADTSTFRVFGSNDGSLDGSKSADLMESGFLSATFVYGSLMDFSEYTASCIEWSSLYYLYEGLGHRLSFQLLLVSMYPY